MSLPSSTLSRVCRTVSDFVSAGLDAANQSIQVTLGSPGSAPPENGDKHRVNLFFYRIDPFGFDNDALPGEVGWIRLQCLVTAFGVLEDKVSVGENDLRLLGEVMRLFHETPVLAPLTLDGETIQLQVVLQPLGTDDINHLWSTQGDIAYRTSVAYEMAVMPIIPKTRAVGSPLVGTVGSEVRAGPRAPGKPFGGSTFVPEVAPVTLDTTVESWAPHLAFLYQDAFAYSLAFAVGGSELAALAQKVQVLILGQPGAAVTLHWDRWNRASGWAPAGDALDATATAHALDPDDTDVEPTDVALPFDDAAGQAVLYAVREYTRATDRAVVNVRSNPLLITLYEPAA